MDSDVPNIEEDGFDHRCHALYTNVPISPTTGVVDLGKLAEEHVAIPWYPPHAQKGSPWHRLSVWVLQQPERQVVDEKLITARWSRDTFTLRKLVAANKMEPVGVTLFRTSWDDTTKEVMERHGIEGAEVEYKKTSITPMRYKKKDGARFR